VRLELMQKLLDVEEQYMAAFFDEIERVCGSMTPISRRPDSPSRDGIGHRLGTAGLIAQINDVQAVRSRISSVAIPTSCAKASMKQGMKWPMRMGSSSVVA
jgi:hypothetical protein